VAAFDENGQDPAHWRNIYEVRRGIDLSYGLEEGVIDKSRISDGVVKRYYMPDGNPDKLNRSMLGTLRINYMDDLEFIEKNLKTIQKPTLILWGKRIHTFPSPLDTVSIKISRGPKWREFPIAGILFLKINRNWRVKKLWRF
jgi:hypothetical protein